VSNDRNEKTSVALQTTQSAVSLAQIWEMSVQAVIDRKHKMLEVMKAVMIDGVHYGKIPGCGDKPVLLKPGAETLAMTFGLSPSFTIERIDLPGGHREYEITCTLTHISSGRVVAQGLGCATTMESKHRWRGGGRKCTECGEAAIIKGKADFGGGWICFAKKGGCGFKWKDGDPAIEKQEVGRIENTDPADQYNTVLKMGKKRAQVDAILTAAGASDILAQDLDDLPPTSASYEDAEFADVRPIERHHPSRPRDAAPSEPAVEPMTDVEIAAVFDGIKAEEKISQMRSVHRPRIVASKGRVPPDLHSRMTKAYEEHYDFIEQVAADDRASQATAAAPQGRGGR
jgi:hypothetical protein